MFVDRRLYVEGTIQYFHSFLDIFWIWPCIFFTEKRKNVLPLLPSTPCPFHLKGTRCKGNGQNDCWKVCHSLFFFQLCKTIEDHFKKPFILQSFLFISPLLFISWLPKKGFHASRCACGQFTKSYKTDGLLLKDSALCLIAVSTLKDVVFCRKLCTFKVVMFVILSPCLLLFQYLNLLNGERLYLSEYVKLIFETDDLTDASPSTVSRCVSMVLSQLFL